MAKNSKTESLISAIAALQKEVDKISIEVQKIDVNEKQLNYLEKNLERIERTVEKVVTQIENMKKDIHDEMRDTYVNNDKFEPVKIIVYGIAGVVLLTVLAALLGIVVIPTP